MVVNDLRKAEGFAVAEAFEEARQELERARVVRGEWVKEARREGASWSACAEVLGLSVNQVQRIGKNE